ncbi:hypothetical protein [Sporofaciens sp. SGI.106]|uniref:hypothetical protein n=1 Tax=Sporofaciens sp. SGI.106 TaxID=3420568 RepID=UPI003D073748
MELYNMQGILTDNDQKKILEKRVARAGMTIREFLQAFIGDLTECNNENFNEWVLLDNWMSRRTKVNIIRYSAEELGDMDYFCEKICLIEAMEKEIEYIKENGMFLDDLPERIKELEIEKKGLEDDYNRFKDWAKKRDPNVQIGELKEELEKIEEWNNALDIFCYTENYVSPSINTNWWE